jgi:phospholipase C
MTFGDLTSAFRFSGGAAKPPVLPDTAGPLTYAQYTSTALPKPTLPGAVQVPPNQEKGSRKHVG